MFGCCVAARVQATVRGIGSGCTIVTIAHRLPTIIDYDKVLVMDRGSVVEFDEPHTLLQRSSMFGELVDSTGKEAAAFLRAAARSAYDSRRAAPASGSSDPVSRLNSVVL